MTNPYPRDAVLSSLILRANRSGFTVMFAEYCEDSHTPGFPGHIGGKCDKLHFVITVSTKRSLHPADFRSRRELRAILEHECRHAEGHTHAGDVPALGLYCGGMRQGGAV